jgi:hypothetical protein
MGKYNLKENIELRRKLLGEAPLVPSEAAKWPTWKPKTPWTGAFAKFEPILKTLGKPFPLPFSEITAYEIPVANDYIYVYSTGNAYSTNFSKEMKYGTHKDYPNAKLVLFDNDDKNLVIGTITIGASGKPQWTQVEPEKTEAEFTKSENPFLDGLQFVLDLIGFIPGIGDVVDIINAAISFARGNNFEGFLSLVGALPVIGSALAVPAKALGKYGSSVASAMLKSFPGFKRASSAIDSQRHMDEMWELIKNSGKFSPADMNKFADGLGDAAEWVKAASKKGNGILPGSAVKSLDELSEWFAKHSNNGHEWIAKNLKVASEPGTFLLKSRKMDDVSKASSLLRKLPGYKFLRNKLTMKLGPDEVAKLKGALNLKFKQSIQTPGQLTAIIKSSGGTTRLIKSDDLINTSLSAIDDLERVQGRQAANRAFAELQNANAGTGAKKLENLLNWTKTYNPKEYEKIRSSVATDAMDPARPNIFYNNFMEGEWQSLKTYTSPAYWGKNGSYIPDITGMQRRFQDYVPILYNELSDVGEDVKAQMGIEEPDDINGLFWPMLKTLVDGGESIGVPGVAWSKKQVGSAAKAIGDLLDLAPGARNLVGANELDKYTYNPETEFVIHPDDSAVIKKKEKETKKRIEKSRSWF